MRESSDGSRGFNNKKRPADDSTDNDRDYKRMRVIELRRRLDSKDLDVDGSKEMLLSRLKAADEDERSWIRQYQRGLQQDRGDLRWAAHVRDAGKLGTPTLQLLSFPLQVEQREEVVVHLV